MEDNQGEADLRSARMNDVLIAVAKELYPGLIGAFITYVFVKVRTFLKDQKLNKTTQSQGIILLPFRIMKIIRIYQLKRRLH